MDIDIGNQIKARREAAGLTQAQLAERAGIKQSAVSEIENGIRIHPRVDTVQKLLGAMDLTLSIATK